MDWKPYFHISLDGGIFLFPFLRISSPASFLLASTFSALVCWLERLLTYLHGRGYVPLAFERMGRTGVAGWRAGMYGVLTFLRLLYMLIAMTFHLGLLFVVVLALSVSQFVIEYGELEHLPSSQQGAYQHLPMQELPTSSRSASASRGTHGYPPSPSHTSTGTARRTGQAYHPYARSRARPQRGHRAHRSSVSYPDVHELLDESEAYGHAQAQASPYGPRAVDRHAAWPYVPEGEELQESREGEEGDAEEEEEGDDEPLAMRMGAGRVQQQQGMGGRKGGLWGEEARDRTREIMRGGVQP